MGKKFQEKKKYEIWKSRKLRKYKNEKLGDLSVR